MYCCIIFLSDKKIMYKVAKNAIQNRRAQKIKEDHILIDSLLDADFIDEEEVGIIFIKTKQAL